MRQPLKAAVIDSSALMCIVKREAAEPLFLKELATVDKLYMSAVTLSELLLAAMSVTGAGVLDPMRHLIEALDVTIVDYCAQDAEDYMKAATVHHLKAVPPGPLNMGDILRGYVMNLANKGVPTLP